jgi:hypothetical protein
MVRQKLTIAILAGVLLTATVLASNGIASSVRGQTSTKSTTTVVRDSSTVLLDGKTIPPMDYIHLYDTTPYKIMNGHIATKLPCDANSVTPLKILVGQAPNFKPALLDLVKELSKPGNVCIYHIDIPQGGAVTTDIAIQNPTNNPIKLPDTSTVVIGVNEIMPLSGAGQSSMMMGNTTK